MSRAAARGRALATALQRRKVLVICGSGGVGKTTTAAALALRAARRGRRVLVCTVDPARRLATSLGLHRLTDTPRELALAGPVKPGGALAAMTLDTKRTFDALVERHAPDEQARRRILDNRIYQEVSSALAGSHEYMAMEKLLDLSRDPNFDLVVLDTPPTRRALDFLEAPDRLANVLDASVLRWLLKPYFVAGRLTLKVASRTGAVALQVADRFLGLKFLQDLSEFFLAFDSLYEGFKSRAGKVYELLRRSDSGFVLVTRPTRTSLDEARYFHERLDQKDMPFVNLVVNRVHPRPSGDGRANSGPPVDQPLARALLRVHGEQLSLARQDRRLVAGLGPTLTRSAVLVPELETDVHNLRGLDQVGDALFGRLAPAGRVKP